MAMMTNMMNADDLLDNPATRLPVCLCLDTSGSMNLSAGKGADGHSRGTRLEMLREGIADFIETVRKDEIARYSVEIAVVTFDTEVRCILPFTTLSNIKQIPDIYAYGDTHMGEGINYGLDLLEERKRTYQQAGADYYQPWMVLMTDGVSNGDENQYSYAQDRVTQMADGMRLVMIPVAIGDGAQQESLKNFRSDHQTVSLADMHFEKFFKWLGKSIPVAVHSAQVPVRLDVNGSSIVDWSKV